MKYDFYEFPGGGGGGGGWIKKMGWCWRNFKKTTN